MKKMPADYLATLAWTNSLDISVRKRKRNRLGKVTRQKIHLDLQDYARDRETELNWLKEREKVDPESLVAFPMLDMKSTNTVFFLKQKEKRPVMVLMMNTRQDIAESSASEEPSERLKEQLLGQCGALRENFEKHGLLNVVTVRPRLSSKCMSSCFFKIENKKKRECDAKIELEMYKMQLRGESAAVSPSSQATTTKTICPFFTAPELLTSGSLSVFPASPLSVGTLRSGTTSPLSSLCRIQSLSLDGRLKEDVSTVEGLFRDVRLTLSTCAVPGDDDDSEDDDETHLDFSKTGSSLPEPDVFLPFVHYTMDEWIDECGGTKASYWRINKRRGQEYLQERFAVVTSKQIREEDRRHLERLKSEHSWKERVAFFGGEW